MRSLTHGAPGPIESASLSAAPAALTNGDDSYDPGEPILVDWKPADFLIAICMFSIDRGFDEQKTRQTK